MWLCYANVPICCFFRVYHIGRKTTKIDLLLVLLILLPVNDIDIYLSLGARRFRRVVINTNSILRNVQFVQFNSPHFGRQANLGPIEIMSLYKILFIFYNFQPTMTAERLVKTYVICFVRADNGIFWPRLLFCARIARGSSDYDKLVYN